MRVVFNGQVVELETGHRLVDLLAQLNLADDRVAVEHNRRLVPRGLWATLELADGDRIEAVQFVGGG